MTNVSNLVYFCSIEYVCHHRFYVFAMVADIEVVKLICIFYGIQIKMPHCVAISSEVSKPDIVASIRSNKGWSLVCKVYDPLIRRLGQAVLEKNWRLWLLFTYSRF